MAIVIIEKTATTLHLSGANINWVFPTLCSMVFGAFMAWKNYESGKHMHVECNSHAVLLPCAINIQKQLDQTPTIQAIKKSVVREEDFDGGTSYYLMLETSTGSYEFPGLTKDDVYRYAELINRFNLPPDSKSFEFSYDDRDSQVIWADIWILFTMLLIISFLYTPTSVDWQFDAHTSLLKANLRFILWRHQFEIPFSHIQQINWKSTVRHHHEGGSTTFYKLDLLRRSGIVMPLVPDLWNDQWAREDSEPVVAAVSQILKIPMPTNLDDSMLRDNG
jgi:hypothetical protein